MHGPLPNIYSGEADDTYLPANSKGNNTQFNAYSQSKMIQGKDGKLNSKETEAYFSQNNQK